jgi:hypothetical protein
MNLVEIGVAKCHLQTELDRLQLQFVFVSANKFMYRSEGKEKLNG